MPDGERVANARLARILDALAVDDAAGFLERIEGRDEVQHDASRGLWLVNVHCLFRIEGGRRFLKSPVERGANEPLLLIEEWYADDGQLVAYNYDVTLPEYGEHFGYHFHGHGAGSYPHRQGHGVPDGHQTYRLVELERDPVLWELVTIATRIDAEASGSLR